MRSCPGVRVGHLTAANRRASVTAVHGRHCTAAEESSPKGVSVVVLDLADVAPYLLDRRLISARAVVDGRLRIVDVSRLNQVFLVTAEGERCFVLKVAGDAGGDGVAREAAVLEQLWSVGDSGDLAVSLPALVAYDGAESVLVLEGAPDARDLGRHHARGRFSCALAREAGRTLALVHAIPLTTLNGLPSPADPTSWIRVHDPDLKSIHAMSPAAEELTRIIQGIDDLCAAVDELVATWHETSVIHGDIRWDNLLAVRGANSRRWTRLQLIDWELCAAGDPAVDIGAFLGEYLRGWLQSIPITDPEDPGRLLAYAGLPLRRMRPALRAFWNAYTKHSLGTAAESGRNLQRAIRFAAVRLLTAALEEAETLYELHAGVLYLVPLSRNLLRRPDEASVHLLGLDASRAEA
jgi:aminoglycoside phosphotransferase (APT) family kinase protein